MGSAIGQLLSAAVGVAISPLPMIALVVMLATPHGRANGIAFVTSWMATLATVGVIMLVIGRGAHEGGKAATWTLWLTLALGVLFALLAVKQWRDRPRPGEAAELPAWMAKVDKFSPGRCAGLAAALSGANPANLALTVGAIAAVDGAVSRVGVKAVALAVFVVVASVSVLVPLGLYMFGGSEGDVTLDSWKTWLSRHNSAIVIGPLVVMSAKFIIAAIVNLT
ncbi:GAP family protein [Streptomyces sp. NPDC050743]|uniref:GAP family protein n=1 Tax=Streptomyces sp. NPDC050743 TaxID=3365634 RepID=UPI00378B447E